MRLRVFWEIGSFVIIYLASMFFILLGFGVANHISEAGVQLAFLWLISWGISGLIYFLFTLLYKAIGPKEIKTASKYLQNPNETQKIKKTDPDFDVDSFLKNCHKLAITLNDAWCNNKMNLVRNLVSAGIYNRFRIQLKIMESQGIRNVMSHWILNSLHVKHADGKSNYQTIHVEISARAKDMNVSTKISEKEAKELVNERPQESYAEIWSFVRKKGVNTKKEYSLLSGNCPNCGTSIQNLGELNQCQSCKSVINSGEYDWVLAEITQPIEWQPESTQDRFDLKTISQTTPLAHKQIIEDRASYLFWRWIEASYSKNANPLKRDITPTYMKNHKNSLHVFDTAVGSVELDKFHEKGDQLQAMVKILWSGATKFGGEPIHQKNILHLTIPIGSSKKSGLSENSCENCGAPLPESDSLHCAYCKAEIPIIVQDWLLEEITTLST